MKPDSSFILYKKYFELKNRIVEVELRNHLVLTGKFSGFFRGGSTYISKWHLVDVNILFGLDEFGFLVGTIIYQKDIANIKFLEDNSIMYF